MRILYGVTGEGLGHAMRSRVVLDLLRADGHEVLVAASARAATYLAARGHQVAAIDGFSLQYADGALLRARTLSRTLRAAPAALARNLAAAREHVDPFAPEVCVTDFDSFAHAWGLRHRVPVVSLDHHHVITRCAHDRAVRALLPRGFSLTQAVVRAKLPGCRRYIASSFYRPRVHPKYARDTAVTGPVLRPEVLPLAPSTGEHVLVYQTSPARSRIEDVLRASPATTFVVHGRGRDERAGNVHFRAFDEGRFLDDLASARAVITNGGHTVMAEALHLGKPLLSVPVRHQGEQELNAAYLQHLGYGLAARRLDAPSLNRFLRWVDAPGRPPAPRVPAGNADVARHLRDALTECAR